MNLSICEYSMKSTWFWICCSCIVYAIWFIDIFFFFLFCEMTISNVVLHFQVDKECFHWAFVFICLFRINVNKIDEKMNNNRRIFEESCHWGENYFLWSFESEEMRITFIRLHFYLISFLKIDWNRSFTWCLKIFEEREKRKLLSPFLSYMWS